MLHRGSRRVKRGDSQKEKERANTRGKKRDGCSEKVNSEKEFWALKGGGLYQHNKAPLHEMVMGEI